MLGLDGQIQSNFHPLRVLRVSAVKSERVRICARKRGSEIHNLRKFQRNYLTRPQGLTHAGDAGTRANVVFGPFIVGQCFLPSGMGILPVREGLFVRPERSLLKIESLMHSGLDQSGSPQLLSGEVRQDNMTTRTGGTPVPPLMFRDSS